MRIGYLHWNERNEDHVARHGVAREEVEEVVAGDEFHIRRVRDRRYGLIGQTSAGRDLAIILDREPDGVFFVVTARPADPDERRLYIRHRYRH